MTLHLYDMIEASTVIMTLDFTKRILSNTEVVSFSAPLSCVAAMRHSHFWKHQFFSEKKLTWDSL